MRAQLHIFDPFRMWKNFLILPKLRPLDIEVAID